MLDGYEFKSHLPEGFDLFGEPLSQEIWARKYRFGSEQSISDTAERVVGGVYAKDPNSEAKKQAIAAMAQGLWIPGGRITAGAGTDKRVTLFNCYVNETIHDSMGGIHKGFGNVMFTMQQGGGIGTDFTPIRPAGAWLGRTKAPASGPIPFAMAQNSIGETVESAGERRGAQMGTLADFHPDLPAWLNMKREKGVMTQFNISVLVSDAFMAAVAEDEQWLLYHSVAPYSRAPELEALDFWDEYTNCQAYVYAVWRARDLWELITRNTYEYSEPGVIFIDRINELNNLYYREQIRCTNPCGEQPLPPDACCDLGAINLAPMIVYPFTDKAYIDKELLRATVITGTRFLDNVTDVTNYPLEQQRIEQEATRRIGLGYSGLATAMAFLGIRYGSQASIRFANQVTRMVAYHTYEASQMLAEERGTFPEYDAEKYWNNNHSFAATRWVDTPLYGKPMRNGVCNTLAPVGTGSIVFGNIDSGIEPNWMLEYERNVRQADNTFKKSPCKSLTARLWQHMFPGEEYPKHFVSAQQLKVQDHVAVQEACQHWIDASISKTINIPRDMPYEDFVDVYTLAYESGLKGCTTFRESDVRGSILLAAPEQVDENTEVKVDLGKRPDFLDAMTAKVKWPALNSAAYVTLGRLENGRPFELFLSSKDQRNGEWMTTATLFISWLLRLGVPLPRIAEEMEQVHSLDGYIVGGRYRPSLVSYIGTTLKEMDARFHQKDAEVDNTQPAVLEAEPILAQGKRCPLCNSPRIIMSQGCEKCMDCGNSKCQ